jgi:hypothetical protein
MDHFIKGNGHKGNFMAKELINGKMGLLMKVIINMEKNTVSENIFILHERFIKANGFKDTNMAEELCSTKKVM